MNKFKVLLSAGVIMAAVSSCNDEAGKDSKRDVDAFAQYVDSVEKASPVYTEDNWAEIDRGYRDRQILIERDSASMEADYRAKAEESRVRYAALKAKYDAKFAEKAEEAKKPDYRAVLRSNLFGAGNVGTDAKFTWVTANNIKDVYSRFVNTVDEKRNDYTREDWDEIKVLYEGLDNRKNEVEKDLATRDNLEIARLKVKFAGIKSVKRPAAKADENEKSKD